MQSPMYVGPPQFKANQYMFTAKGRSSWGLPHPGYTPQFSQAQDAYHQLPSKFAPSVRADHDCPYNCYSRSTFKERIRGNTNERKQTFAWTVT
jgi:hypothetical protein